jgi:hypothetical protein
MSITQANAHLLRPQPVSDISPSLSPTASTTPPGDHTPLGSGNLHYCDRDCYYTEQQQTSHWQAPPPIRFNLRGILSYYY